MNLAWIVTGIILFGGMAAGAISLWIKRRRESQAVSDYSFFDTGVQPDFTDLGKNDEK